MRFTKTKLFIFIVLLAVVGALELKHSGYYSKPVIKTQNSLFYVHPIRVGDAFFVGAFATTDAERTKGLSGTEKLDSNQALLFVFQDNDKWGIWMKDMNYSIDIIWLTEKGEVSYLKENVSPNTYPEVFYPPVSERYVLEVPAGTIEKTKIKYGDLLLY